MGFNKKEYTEQIKEFPIWKLIEIIHYNNKRIIELKKQGESVNQSRIVRKLSYKRNLVLDILTDKLNLWKNDKNNSSYSIGGFADVQEIDLNDIEMEILENDM